MQSLAGELGEHLADPSTLALHAERFARAVEDAPRAKGQKAALPAALATKVAAQRFRAALLPLVGELAERKRAELAKKGPGLFDQVVEQAGKLGQDVAARASAVGAEVAQQSQGAAKDTRKRVGAISR